jgi:MFS family permease
VEKQTSLTQPFRSRNFVLIWTGQTISSLGNAMYVVALAWSVYDLTGSPADMSVVLILNMIPRLVLTLVGGALADRLPRRSILLVGDVAAGLLTLLLVVLVQGDGASFWLIALASFGLGVVSAFFDPAYRSIYRNILPIEEQQAAVSVANATINLTSIVGPALSGVIFAVGGAGVCFGVNSLSFFLSALCTRFVAIPHQPVEIATTIWSDVRAGIGFVLRTRWLRTTLLLDMLANLVCIAPLNVLLPAIVKLSGGGSEFLGLAMGIQAASTALSSLLVGKYGRYLPRGPAVYGLIAVAGLGVAMLAGGQRQSWLIPLAALIIGLGFAFNTVAFTLIQEHAPERYLSRVWGVATVASLGLMPIGYAVTGVLAELAGVPAVLLGGGGTLVVITLVMAMISRWSLPGLPNYPTLESEAAGEGVEGEAAAREFS